ncbi:uncharacterized protein LOC141684748 [Apium graveolens]|uniref:uncharacterized protein LOC141684748 n=1 Tax=Apium graveolens TaxID=4045 RepID=UPI003D7A5DDA
MGVKAFGLLVRYTIQTGKGKPGKLYLKGRQVIPKGASLKDTLLKEYHGSPTGGHAGEVKTYLHLASEWYWSGMRKGVAAFVQSCGEVDTILVVVDRLSKYSHFLGLKHPFSAMSVAEIFMKEIVRLHGFPSSIVSDHDRVFLSIFWRELFKMQVADSKRREENFEVGEVVYIKLQSYRQRSLAKRPFEKLAARFYGPFEVCQQVGKVAYKLKLPPESKLHQVFHMSQLRRATRNIPFCPTIPNQLNSDLELVVQLEQLLDVRIVGTKEQGRREALIRWKGLPIFDATWEEVMDIKERFPEFHLEDKVLVWDGSNVMQQGQQSKGLKVFTRKKNRKN